MTKKELLYSRRREMYRLHVTQLEMSDILEKLSTKYRISKRTLDKDWQKRTQWVYDVFDLEPRLAVWTVNFCCRAWEQELLRFRWLPLLPFRSEKTASLKETLEKALNRPDGDGGRRSESSQTHRFLASFSFVCSQSRSFERRSDLTHWSAVQALSGQLNYVCWHVCETMKKCGASSIFPF
jgi:hypothetical protein